MKLVKSSGKTFKLSLINSKFVSDVFIGKRDTVFFTCKKCGNEGHRRVSLFKDIENITDRDLFCEQCNREQNSIDKYGVKNPMQRKDVFDKYKKSVIKKYGVDNIQKNPLVKQKTIETNIKRYGGKAPACSEEIKQKIKNTNIKKYGVECVFQFEEIILKKEKAENKRIKNLRKSFLEKYGVDNIGNIDTIREKALISIKKNRSIKLSKIIDNLHEREIKIITNIRENDLNKPALDWLKENAPIKLQKGDRMFEVSSRTGFYKTNGTKLKGTSKMEKEINDFIRSLGFNTIENSRSIIPPQEIDIFIPEKNMAIEFDGLFWHSQQQLEKTGNKAKNYHKEKTFACHEKGVRLIHIFEDEWRDKQEVCKNRLRSFLGLNERKIGARKTIIKEIDAKISKGLVGNYHIQGNIGSRIKLGAYFEDELIGVMTFGVPRVNLGQKDKKRVEGHYELMRFVTAPNTATPGLASKMFTFFIRNYSPSYIYTYSDLRWNKIDFPVYEKIGMKKVSYSSPSYFYFKVEDQNPKRENRFKYRKNMLPILLENFDKEKTEYQNMLDNGYDRIFDVGCFKYEWKK